MPANSSNKANGFPVGNVIFIVLIVSIVGLAIVFGYIVYKTFILKRKAPQAGAAAFARLND
jgi:hypothetical protein